uniref:Uncharacterized protein n=1 Tax=viral metagenome TaxID=1070528 RepID=A0A6C0CBJ0_9ZZZZ
MAMFLMGLASISSTLSDKMKETGKFISHLLFISLTCNTVWSTLAIMYNCFFYFGFFNTIVNLFLFSFLVMGGFVQMAQEGVMDWMGKYTLGQQILTGLNNYYDLYIVSANLWTRICEHVKYVFKNYVQVYGTVVIDKLLTVNADLSDNLKSKKVIARLDKKYAVTKDMFMQEYLQPYFFSLIESTISGDPFQNVNNSYKVNTDMTDKFEKMVLDSEIDNLSDEDEDTSPAAVPIEPPKVLSPEENRQMLRKKIAAKKAARGNRNKQMQMSTKSQPPNMNKMMETMMQGDNLKKFMTAFPPDKMDPANLDDKQLELMMQMMKDMNKKK